MRLFSGVSSAFWSSEGVKGLPPGGKLLALYLLTCPHGNAAGVFHLPLGYVTADTGFSEDDARLAFDTLRWSESHPNGIEEGFASYCHRTEWVVIHKAMKHVGKINAKYAKHILDRFAEIPSGATIKDVAAAALTEYGKGLPEAPRAALLERLATRQAVPVARSENPIAMGLQTHPNPIGYVGTGTGTGNQSQKLSGGVPDGTRPGSKSPGRKVAPPKAEGQDALPPTAQTWLRFAAAYQTRYGHEPSRSAQVNGQLAHLVSRIGKDEAPEVAAWYLEVADPFYVKQRHPPNLLLRDVERIRGLWITGKRGEEERAPPAPPWWATDKGIVDKAKELGMSTRAGESYPALRERIRERLASGN